MAARGLQTAPLLGLLVSVPVIAQDKPAGSASDAAALSRGRAMDNGAR
ncbi:MAG: hypothetical protein QOH81_1918 [Sphingomonadales bacterium]|jgi:hypothetical protein|nr:hypothetical protein [Sphingomonadales bacterium]